MRILNWELLSHPMNWVVIFLMLFIGGIGITLVLNMFSTPSQSS